MTNRDRSEVVGSAASLTTGPGLGATILRVAWLSVLLGLAMEILLLVLAVIFNNMNGAKPFVADVVQKISWSLIVCIGLAFGSTISQSHIPLTGLMGLFAAPLGFNIARVLHKGATEALGLTGGATLALGLVVLLSLLKGLEYGCLGAALAWLGRRKSAGGIAHAGAGLSVGVVFGAVILAAMFAADPLSRSTVALLSRGVNEVLFPVGCSLVIFASDRLGRQLTG